jgi:hypothetical protein
MKNGFRLVMGARVIFPDGDWPEQYQSGTVAVRREPVADVLVQVKVRALDLALTTHSGPDREVRAAAW